MTKKELLKVLSDLYSDAVKEYIKATDDSPEELTAHMVMKAWGQAFELVAESVDEPEPEPSKKLRYGIELTEDNDGLWWAIVKRWDDRDTYTIAYATPVGCGFASEALYDAEAWIGDNP